MRFAISDWVQGRTKDGELIQGFITSINVEHNIASVYVVQSDHDAAVGTTVSVPGSRLKEQPTLSVLDYEEPILDLIELALSTKDSAWFEELAERLHVVRQQDGGADAGSSPLPHHPNRLGQMR